MNSGFYLTLSLIKTRLTHIDLLASHTYSHQYIKITLTQYTSFFCDSVLSYGIVTVIDKLLACILVTSPIMV